MKLSVVIPAYNCAGLIGQTLDSVLSDSTVSKEVIVVDDGSTDNLSHTLSPYLESNRIRYFRQDNSGGPASPRNRGLSEASGEFVLFLDADDVVVSSQLLPTLEQMEANPEATMACGNFDVTDSELNVRIGRNIDRYRDLQEVLNNELTRGAWILSSFDAVRTLLQSNYVGTSSVIARREALIRAGSFDESMKNLDDRDMWIRLAQLGPIIYRSEVFYLYRDVPGSVSKQREVEQFRERVRVAEKVLSSSPDREIRREAKKWRARSLLKIGYILFHEQGDRLQARTAFARSFTSWPTLPAFKGVIKSLLPERLYQRLAKP
ncbi:glycosyltransferase family 2 protein [Marinobacter mobilis]|uniref:Glycosyltransferase involved in cell wall bisynthesis n=1 Tax=Marinobacter mobilis TaxID=488533 RepID=A0A1H2UWC5_9GAMM|nr:glycosyltransferase [Marinobacter mobilis]SDW60298.1 Glycosyltransferase involved in cell wall bisynthesis [Marinobacter mobilis]